MRTTPARLRLTVLAAVLGLVTLVPAPAHTAADSLQDAIALYSQTYGLGPDQVRALYDVTPILSSGVDGSGQTIVLMEECPVTDAERADYAAFAQQWNLPPLDVTVVSEDAWEVPVPVCSGAHDLELTLDVELAHEIAPGARLYVYAALPCPHLSDALETVARDHPQAVVSVSLYACERGSRPEEEVDHWIADLDSAARKVAEGGGTVLVASGDEGAYANLAIHAPNQSGGSLDWPKGIDAITEPATVTDVGGTRLVLSADGTVTGEAAWGEPASQAGSGGGNALTVARPAWQKGPGVDNSFSDGMRQMPDVSALSDPGTPYRTVDSGRELPGSGTSAAAPLWAGIVALVDAHLARKGLHPVGFANPALYWFGANAASLPAAPFHDVTTGDDLLHPATPGWDEATGWGSPDAAALADDWAVYAASGMQWQP